MGRGVQACLLLEEAAVVGIQLREEGGNPVVGVVAELVHQRGVGVVVRPHALRWRLLGSIVLISIKTLTLYRPDLTSDRADSPIVPIATLPVRKKAFDESQLALKVS